MAATTIQAEPIETIPVANWQRLHAAYRHAKANYEALLYAPENVVSGAPQAEADKLHETYCSALNAFLLAPAETPNNIAEKLNVFREEEIHQGWYLADEIVARLARDAEIAWRQ